MRLAHAHAWRLVRLVSLCNVRVCLCSARNEIEQPVFRERFRGPSRAASLFSSLPTSLEVDRRPRKRGTREGLCVPTSFP